MLHFCTHPWEVQDMEDGTLVRFSQRDLDPETVSVLVDDLYELVLESGRPNLYLDFGRVYLLATMVIGKLISLDKKLQTHGGKLVLGNVNADLHQILRAIRVADVLEVRREWDFALS